MNRSAQTTSPVTSRSAWPVRSSAFPVTFFEPAAWLNHDPAAVQSLVMLPLRGAGADRTFGLVVLGSPDKDRFHVTMGTAFLRRIADIAGAALLRLAR